MKNLTMLAAAILLLGGLSACANNDTGRQPPAAGSEPESAVSLSEAPPVLDQDMEPAGNITQEGERIVIPEVPIYRGVLSDLTDTGDGSRQCLLSKAQGTAFPFESVSVTIDEQTRSDSDLQSLAEGDYIEVFYADNHDGRPVVALALNRLYDADLSVYNGTVVRITPNDGDGDIELQDLDSENTTVFHYGDFTDFYINISEIQPGDMLNIYHSGALTFSIPPQGNALEVYAYNP